MNDILLAEARSTLRSILRHSKKKSKSEMIVKSDDFFKLVYALSQMQEFDEKTYLSTHEDVREAVKRGEYKSGRDHFHQSGFLEGRVASFRGFEAETYFDLNEDLQKVFSRSDAAGLTKHYIEFGFAEGRRIAV